MKNYFATTIMLTLFLMMNHVLGQNEKNPSDSTLSTSEIACTLSSAELAKRVADLRKDIFNKVKITEEVAYGYTFTFDDDDELLRKLMDYLILERQCCAFFRFDLAFLPDRGGLVLQIAGPPEAREMLTVFVSGLEP